MTAARDKAVSISLQKWSEPNNFDLQPHNKHIHQHWEARPQAADSFSLAICLFKPK